MALYDPHEFPETVETTTDFSLEDVLAWARTKPADEAYDFCDSRICALAQFGLATGRNELVGPSGSSVLDRWPELRDAVCGPGGDDFGQLVARLEKALAQ